MLTKDDSGWWFVQINGVKGWAPSTYMQPMNTNTTTTTTTTVSPANRRRALVNSHSIPTLTTDIPQQVSNIPQQVSNIPRQVSNIQQQVSRTKNQPPARPDRPPSGKSSPRIASKMQHVTSTQGASNSKPLIAVKPVINKFSVPNQPAREAVVDDEEYYSTIDDSIVDVGSASRRNMNAEEEPRLSIAELRKRIAESIHS